MSDSKAVFYDGEKLLSQFGDTEVNQIANQKFGDDTNFSEFEADGTLAFNGDARVWLDIDFSVIVRVTGPNRPTLTTFNGNLTMPEWAVNDFYQTETQELIHSWAEGTQCFWHIHLTTQGSDTTDRFLKFEVEYGYTTGGTNAPWQFDTITSNDLLIPANTPEKTMFIFGLGSFTPTGAKIGDHVIARLRRVAADGTAPSEDPWIPMLQMHIQLDTVGSRQMTSKNNPPPPEE